MEDFGLPVHFLMQSLLSSAAQRRSSFVLQSDFRMVIHMYTPHRLKLTNSADVFSLCSLDYQATIRERRNPQ